MRDFTVGGKCCAAVETFKRAVLIIDGLGVFIQPFGVMHFQVAVEYCVVGVYGGGFGFA